MPVNEFADLRVAAVQAASVMFDTDATISKVDRLVSEAAANGAKIVAFGESFISAFPIWANVLPPVEQHDFQIRLVESAMEVPGPETARLGAIARDNDVLVSVGINEVSPTSVGTVWNANLMFAPDGQLVNHRRKLVATWAERLAWSHGDGYDLEPVQAHGASVGALVCGENTNTLARFSLLAQGEEIHISTYPPAWPFDTSGERAEYDLTESIRLRSAAHSFEGKVFNIVAAAVLDDDAVEIVARGDEKLAKTLRAMPPASMILGPVGEYLAGPLVGEEGILYADVQTRDRIVPKQAQDIVGTYNRFDVFSFGVNKVRHAPITVTDEPIVTPENGASEHG